MCSCYGILHNILFGWQDLRAGTICCSAYIQHPVKSRSIQQPEAETLNNVIRSYCVTLPNESCAGNTPHL